MHACLGDERRRLLLDVVESLAASFFFLKLFQPWEGWTSEYCVLGYVVPIYNMIFLWNGGKIWYFEIREGETGLLFPICLSLSLSYTHTYLGWTGMVCIKDGILKHVLQMEENHWRCLALPIRFFLNCFRYSSMSDLICVDWSSVVPTHDRDTIRPY